jgi:hypothetical protein
VLQERAAAGKLRNATQAAIRKQLLEQADVSRQLRAFLALRVTDRTDPRLPT